MSREVTGPPCPGGEWSGDTGLQVRPVGAGLQVTVGRDGRVPVPSRSIPPRLPSCRSGGQRSTGLWSTPVCRSPLSSQSARSRVHRSSSVDVVPSRDGAGASLRPGPTVKGDTPEPFQGRGETRSQRADSLPLLVLVEHPGTLLSTPSRPGHWWAL